MTIEEFEKKHRLGKFALSIEEQIAKKKANDRLKPGTDFCVMGCGQEFPISEMVLITPEENPYDRLDDGTPMRLCRKCAEAEASD